MQQELLNRADAILNSISTAVGTAKDFAMEQLPDIAYQFVTFGRFYESSAMFVASVFIAIGLYVVLFVSRKYKEDNKVITIVVGVVMSIIGSLIVLGNFKTFALVWFAPKVWLMVEIVKLVK